MTTKTMPGFIANIEDETIHNANFRTVLFTGAHSQLVVMSLKPGEEIGDEVHEDTDQFFRVEAGDGKVIMDGEEFDIHSEYAFVVPAGTRHNVKNGKHRTMKLYTIYSPPNHPDGTVHRTKAEADAAEHHH